mgnify:CR=1 FL=1
MVIKKDVTLGEWFKESRSQGYSVPVSMCHGIQVAMKELDKSFPDVFELFLQRAIIVLMGKTFFYNLQGHRALIPAGLSKCGECGEYKGKVIEKDLNWEDSFHKERAEKSEEYLGVSCLCDGILCRACNKNKIHRPISNTYDVATNQIWHYPYFQGMKSCGECREKQNQLKKPKEEWEVLVRLPQDLPVLYPKEIQKLLKRRRIFEKKSEAERALHKHSWSPAIIPPSPATRNNRETEVCFECGQIGKRFEGTPPKVGLIKSLIKRLIGKD